MSSTRVWVGIDPGMDGYVAALLNSEGHETVQLEAIPTLKSGKGAKRLYDVPGLLEVVKLLAHGAELVLLEKQQAMPGQGVSSCFSLGYGYGLVRMALVSAGVRYEEVSPADWKRKLGLTKPGRGLGKAARRKQAKALAVQKAQALYPGVSLKRTERSRAPSPDMAEALLLARYAKHRATGLPL